MILASTRSFIYRERVALDMVFKEDDVWNKSPSGNNSYRDCEDTFEYSFKDDLGKEIRFSVREKGLSHSIRY